MANQEHVDILAKGVGAWNQWRQTPEGDRPDIRRESFIGLDLRNANFSDSLMYRADFSKAQLEGATLEDSDLASVSFRGANLQYASLRGSDLHIADLAGAHLGGADLVEAVFSSANLAGANFHEALMGDTIITNVDLSSVVSLETVIHHGPSSVGLDTIYRSQGKVPEPFLRGAGVPDNFIAYMKSLTGAAFEFYSCFISHSSKDQDFATRLHADLQARGVRCWYAPEDLKIGDKFRPRIDEAIRIHDKLLIVLSEHSIRSAWVASEVESAFEREHREGRTLLFPIRLDDAIVNTTEAWAAEIRRTRHIGDFSNWKHHDSYQRGLDRLLRDLKSEGNART